MTFKFKKCSKQLIFSFRLKYIKTEEAVQPQKSPKSQSVLLMSYDTKTPNHLTFYLNFVIILMM